jgi:hypothetical protein
LPWRVEPAKGEFKVVDANGEALVHIYSHEMSTGADTTLTLDEARRIAVNVAKRPGLLGRAMYV